jgi:uncharacterized protein with beta-barrel porin domain
MDGVARQTPLRQNDLERAARDCIASDEFRQHNVRLGWQHEYADTARPVTASFAGAPGEAFTVFGATPQRDSAALSLAASTHVSHTTELYARYDGDIGNGSENHAFTAGMCATW